MTTQNDADRFVNLLNEKFAGTDLSFSAMHGIVRDRIVVTYHDQRSAYAFVDTNGNVLKPDSWKRPAPGIRYTSVEEAAIAADPFGSFLYNR